MKTDLFQFCGHCWVFQIWWHIECSTFTASSLRIWNSSTGIPSPPLALFIVMLSKAHLTSHSRMSGSRWVITPSWLSSHYYCEALFLYSSSVYSCHLFLIFSASVRSIPFLPFIEPIFAWDVQGQKWRNYWQMEKHEWVSEMLWWRKKFHTWIKAQRVHTVCCYCSVTQSCSTLCDPMTVAHQASLSFTISQSFFKLMSTESVMPSNRLILCCPLLLLPSIFPSFSVFSKESALYLRRPRVLELQLQHQSFQWIFRVDFLTWLVWSQLQRSY